MTPIRNTDLVSDHFNAKFPNFLTYGHPVSQILDEIIFRPSIEVKIQYAGEEKTIQIQTPHTPTDYSALHLKSKFDLHWVRINLLTYTNGLSNLLLDHWGKSQRFQLVYQTQRVYGNKLVYEVFFQKYKD